MTAAAPSLELLLELVEKAAPGELSAVQNTNICWEIRYDNWRRNHFVHDADMAALIPAAVNFIREHAETLRAALQADPVAQCFERDERSVATVCLRGERYGNGRFIALDVQTEPGVEFPIGTKLYTTPPPAALQADRAAVAWRCVFEEAEGTRRTLWADMPVRRGALTDAEDGICRIEYAYIAVPATVPELHEAATTALAAMDNAKRLLRAAGFEMESGTISRPYNEAAEALRAALAKPTDEAPPQIAGAVDAHGFADAGMEAASKAVFVPCDCGCGRSCCANCGTDVGFVTSPHDATTPAPVAVESAKRWPFVESPGEFAERLKKALRFNSVLAAVRHVLIENPPTLATPTGRRRDAGSDTELLDYFIASDWTTFEYEYANKLRLVNKNCDPPRYQDGWYKTEREALIAALTPPKTTGEAQ